MQLLPPESSSVQGARVALKGHQALVTWRNLSYNVKQGIPCIQRETKREVLSNLSGCLLPGTLSAVMGPSGAGKTTLLNCLSGKIVANVTGEVGIRVQGNDKNKIRIGFVPQKDRLFPQFTVRETLMFASHMNNTPFSHEDHRKCVNKIMASLNIIQISEITLSRVSGGEMKRTSIATELVSRPRILFLDEPTTGLDSDNSESVIKLLKNMTKAANSPVIVATIHQPSFDVFMKFDQIYVLNKYGQGIYSGLPGDVMRYLAFCGLEQRTGMNPAEYMIEVANGKHGEGYFQKMMDKFPAPKTWPGKVVSITRITSTSESSGFHQFYLLCKRSLVSDTIKSYVLLVRILLGIFFALLLAYLPSEPIGKSGGCWTDLFQVPGNITEGDFIRSLVFGLSDSVQASDGKRFDVIHQNDRISESMILFFLFSRIQVINSALTMIAYFPMNLSTSRREISNNWYTSFPFFAATVMVESLISALIALTSVPVIWYLSGFPCDAGRLFLVTASTFVLGLIWGIYALIFTTIFSSHSYLAMAIVIAISMEDTLTSGFAWSTQSMTPMFQKVSLLTSLKYYFTITYSAAFGYDRCEGGQLSAQIINEVMTESSMIRIASGIWPLLNVTANDLVPMSRVLGLPEYYFNQLPFHMGEFLGIQPHGDPIEDGEQFQTSLILHNMDMADSDVLFSFLCLCSYCLVVSVVLFITLRLNTKFVRF